LTHQLNFSENERDKHQGLAENLQLKLNEKESEVTEIFEKLNNVKRKYKVSKALLDENQDAIGR